MITGRSARRAAVALILASSGALVRAAAQAPAKSPLTLEWIFSAEGRRLAQLPEVSWLANGTLMYDDDRPAGDQAIEIIDPSTAERRHAMDAPAALASLNALLPADRHLTAVPWPDSFDGTGHRALYVFDGDIFVLDLQLSRFTRLTTTAAEERSASFAPDGQRVAFVRDNDLFVIDLASRAESRLTHDGSATTLNGTLTWLYWEEVFGRLDMRGFRLAAIGLIPARLSAVGYRLG
jgi:dipeptidyl-peptidase 4